MCCTDPSTTQAAKKNPNAAPMDHSPASAGAAKPTPNAANATQRKRSSNSPQFDSRQRTTVPGTMMTNKGTIRGTNTALKYCGPTDNLPKLSASITSG